MSLLFDKIVTNYGKINHRFDLLAFMIIFSICWLKASNGIASIVMQLAFIVIVLSNTDFFKSWWLTIRYFILGVLFLLILLVLNSFSYKQALHEAWGVMRGLLMSLLAVYLLQLQKERIYQAALMVFFFSFVLVVCFFILNVYEKGVQGTIQKAGIEIFAHRNSFGSVLSYICILGFSLLLQQRNIIKFNVLFLFLSVLVTIACINYSRGALLGLAVASITMLCLRNLKWALVLICIGMGIGVLLLLNQENFLGTILFHNKVSSFLNGREFLWPPIWERVEQSPWFGYGLHAVNNDPVLLEKNIEKVSNVHSIYLDIIYASGIFGVIFWVGWIALLARKMKEELYANNELCHYLGVGFLMFLLTHGLFDLDFYSLGTSAVFSFSGILILAYMKKRKNHENIACC